MSKVSAIDKRIAELESEIEVRQHAIAVLRSVQKRKPVTASEQPKPRKARRPVVVTDVPNA